MLKHVIVAHLQVTDKSHGQHFRMILLPPHLWVLLTLLAVGLDPLSYKTLETLIAVPEQEHL